MECKPNTEIDLAGYKIYKSETPGGPYDVAAYIPLTTEGFDKSKPTYGIEYLPKKRWFFVVTAYDTKGFESEYSKEITTHPLPPGRLKIRQVTVRRDEDGGSI